MHFAGNLFVVAESQSAVVRSRVAGSQSLLVEVGCTALRSLSAEMQSVTTAGYLKLEVEAVELQRRKSQLSGH